MKKNIAIIGGGIGGLTAAYLLNQQHDITLFEKNGRLGGNAYTHVTKTGETIDMTVAAYSKYVSGNFLKLLSELGVETVIQPGNAALTVHNMETNSGVYLNPYNPFNQQSFSVYGRVYRASVAMYECVKMLDEGKLKGLSVEDALALVPWLTKEEEALIMAPLCLLSSMYYIDVMKAPAEFFMAKTKAFKCFGPIAQMFGLRFPKNFTKSYVDALAKHYPDRVVLNSKIESVAREDDRVILRMEDGHEAVFHKVVFACNADQALELLQDPTETEQRLLGAWRYQPTYGCTHTDNSSFPKRSRCQSWTCLLNTRNGQPHFSVSNCHWRLNPAVPRNSQYISTQHQNFPIKEELIDHWAGFRTPIFDFKSFATVKELPSLNGQKNSYYCGSHFGWGLHNDAVTSAIEVTKHLGIQWS